MNHSCHISVRAHGGDLSLKFKTDPRRQRDLKGRDKCRGLATIGIHWDHPDLLLLRRVGTPAVRGGRPRTGIGTLTPTTDLPRARGTTLLDIYRAGTEFIPPACAWGKPCFFPRTQRVTARRERACYAPTLLATLPIMADQLFIVGIREGDKVKDLPIQASDVIQDGSSWRLYGDKGSLWVSGGAFVYAYPSAMNST